MSALVSRRITLATAHRVLLQLRGDRRTVGMLLVVPSVLLVLINRMFDSQPDFDQVGLRLLGIFPFTLMFLITSVAMLRERTSGTLERLLTTPMSKLDLLLGYGIAFAVAAALQGGVTCLTAYLLLGLYTPGSPWLVFGITISSAVLGMSLGLLSSAFATTEFQAVQFMPAVVMPQVLLGGLFVPREQMADWLESLSNLLPMTYAIEALKKMSETSLVDGELLGDLAIMTLATAAALGLAATTLRRRGGEMAPSVRRSLLAVPYLALLVVSVLALGQMMQARRYVWTDNAETDGDRITVTAPAGGTLVGWRATKGTTLRKGQVIGRIELSGGFARPVRVIRAPADGTVARDNVVEGTSVLAGAELAVAYDLAGTTITARIDETDIGEVHPGRQVDVHVDGYPDVTLLGYVRDIQGSTAELVSANPRNNTTGSFQKVTQVVPVTIAIADTAGVALVPGMNAEVKIRRD